MSETETMTENVPAYLRSTIALAQKAAERSAEQAASSRRTRRRTAGASDGADASRQSEGEKATRSRKAASAEAVAEGGEGVKPARRRARAAQADEPASNAADGGEEAKPKRRRGRPTKAEVEARKAAQAAAESGRASDSDAAAAVSAEDGAAEKPKRRRGRPTKAEIEARKAAEMSTSEQANEGDRRPDQAERSEEARQEDNARRADDAHGSSEDGRKNRTGKNQQQQRQDRQQRDRKNGHDRQDRNAHQNQRRQRRQHQSANREVRPSVTREELAALKVAELREKAVELELAVAGLKKAELVEAVYAASMQAEGFVEVEGILDTMPDGYGFLRTQGYLPSEHDAYVSTAMIRRNGLRKGDHLKGQLRPKRENEKFAAVQTLAAVNGTPVEELGPRVKFADLTPIYPDECLQMEHGKNAITARVIDLVSPIGKGQRGLIVSPPKAGKTTILKDVAAAITANNPEVHLMCLLVDERPEEVTDMQRSIKGEVISSTFDMPTENHIAVSELVIERAKRLVECGKDVVILLDSITRLARAYNLAQPASGRILSGGVDSTALYPPKRFLGAARNIEGGGSLTILASALIDTGSKMDEVIFEEFKGTGNMELRLDRNLADRRIFPAIDPIQSGTRKEDLLLDPQEAPLIWGVRRILSNMNNTERAMDMLIKSLKQTDTNQEFLLRTAKKAQGNQGHRGEEGFAL